MNQERKKTLSKVMKLAWQFVKRNGFTMREALITAWANAKLLTKMSKGIARFYFRKVDGTIREAYGTLQAELLPAIQDDHRKPNDTIQTYYDTEKQAWRCFKKANVIEL